VTFHCAVWGVLWNNTRSEMWRCKIRWVGYDMHIFITNKMEKGYHSVFFSIVVMIFFLEARPVSGVVRECHWKTQTVTASSRTFNRTGKALSVFVRNVNTFSFLKKILFFSQQERLRPFLDAGHIKSQALWSVRAGKGLNSTLVMSMKRCLKLSKGHTNSFCASWASK
jgi:hypothetical protein